MTTCWNCNKEYPAGASSCPHCRVPVTKEAVDSMATIGPGGAPSVQIVPGSVVSGRYEVRQEIGRGGMGIVYLAFDRTLEQEVALKVIPQELCMDPRAIADLKRETGIALKLTHPNILRLHTLDTWEGQAYVVMAYVSGGTLAHLLAGKQRLSLDEALPLLQQIASALDYSHTTSPAVIHRDLKPLNILLTDQGEIKVADFGLARVLRDSASRISGHDSAGTLAYMAPEQVRGKGIGRHTDIYALAAISYEMLAGHPPFHTGDLRWQIMHEEPDPIADQPDMVNQALLKGLAKDVAARPGSADDFVHSLTAEPSVKVADFQPDPEIEDPQPEQKRAEPETAPQPEQLQPTFGERERKEDVRKQQKSTSKAPTVIFGIIGVIVALSVVAMSGGFDSLLRGIKSQQKKEVATYGKSFTDPTTGMEFVFVKGGCYEMGDTFGDGSDDEKPVHKVCVDDFYMGKYEVTQGEYQKITGSNPSGFKKGDRYPVERVSWDDAQSFIRKLNQRSAKKYRLPTEAEWEYAARSGGKKEKYAGGNSIGTVGWYGSNSGKSTHRVGTKQANGLGIYDMSGNVWEWCQDWYSSGFYKESSRYNPTGPSSGSDRVLRGGGWDYVPGYTRAANRDGYGRGFRYDFLGFRLVFPAR